LEKLLQKMDEYIRADNDFRQRREEDYRFSEMTRGFEVNNRGHNIPCKLRGSNKAIFGRQLQEAEAPEALEEGLGISLGKFIAYSVVRTRAILQGCAMSPFINRRK
jgi:hypothetical protein